MNLWPRAWPCSETQLKGHTKFIVCPNISSGTPCSTTSSKKVIPKLLNLKPIRYSGYVRSCCLAAGSLTSSCYYSVSHCQSKFHLRPGTDCRSDCCSCADEMHFIITAALWRGVQAVWNTRDGWWRYTHPHGIRAVQAGWKMVLLLVQGPGRCNHHGLREGR